MYRNAETVLVISGVGKIAMAAAVGFTLAQFAQVTQPVMLNLGIAGHCNQSIGSCFLADKLIDTDTLRRFYPQIPFDQPFQTLPLKTVSKPDTHYADDYLCDMEAAAFYEIAVKFSSAELIHSVKLVSDNQGSGLAHINEAAVMAWMQAQVASVEKLISVLMGLRLSLPVFDNQQYEQLLGQFHFSVTNAVRLQALLNQWRLLSTDAPLDFAQAHAKSARELLIWLETQIEKKPFYL